MILNILFIAALVASKSHGLSELDDMTEADSKELKQLQDGWESGWQKFLVQGINIESRQLVRFATTRAVKFFLWTRRNPEELYVLKAFNNDSLLDSYFNAKAKTFVIFHGFTHSGALDWILDIKNELLKKYDCNVISVDYGLLVIPPFYVTATMNVYKVANLTANLLDWMNLDFGLDFQNLHLVGHSLGAHAAGMVGHNVKRGTIARITGMDPAGPLFINQKPDKMISQDSATFVDIIHSNGGSVASVRNYVKNVSNTAGCYGLLKPVGHVDFYPNGGSRQPSCTRLKDRIACSHNLSFRYWKESIRGSEEGNTFVAWSCDSWDSFKAKECNDCQSNNCTAEIGLNANKSASGKFYLRTNEESPYAMGMSGKF